jgi:hypothetical protein
MPRIPIDYSKACVYRLVFNYITYYVGSTTNFRRRKCEYKRVCSDENREEYERPLYRFIRETGGWSEDWCMVLVQEYPDCKSSNELCKYEREHYDFYKPELNINKPCLKEGEKDEQQKQYYIKNRDKINENSKQYYTENLDKIKIYSKQYNIENADAIKEYTKQYQKDNADKKREMDKEYYCKNADKKKEISKQYYTQNVEKIKEHKKIKYTCQCGVTISNGSTSTHSKTKKHINYLNNLSTNAIDA